MEKAEALSNQIRDMNAQIYELKKRIKQKTCELKYDCPHESVREEYDDDFHKTTPILFMSHVWHRIEH